MKTCPKCGEQNPNEAKFCKKCGEPFTPKEEVKTQKEATGQSSSSSLSGRKGNEYRQEAINAYQTSKERNSVIKGSIFFGLVMSIFYVISYYNHELSAEVLGYSALMGGFNALFFGVLMGLIAKSKFIKKYIAEREKDNLN